MKKTSGDTARVKLSARAATEEINTSNNHFGFRCVMTREQAAAKNAGTAGQSQLKGTNEI